MPPAAKKKPPAPRQHGVKGVYYGGDWLDLEDCDGIFTGLESECSGCTNYQNNNNNTNNNNSAKHACPRSRSANAKVDGNTTATTSKDDDDLYDVCIIGAGCIGAAIARELSKYTLKVLWVEAADDVSQGATKGNSGIVHAGYDDKPGTNRAKYCWKGNQMFKDLDKDLRFGYQTNGSLVIATSDHEKSVLQDLLQRGHTNGVERLRIVDKKELFEMEPHLNPNAVAALYSPDAGNVIPYEFTIALAENAVDNGIELKIRRRVTSISSDQDDHLVVHMDYWEPNEYLQAKALVDFNATRMAIIGAAILMALAGVLRDNYLPAPIAVLLILYELYPVLFLQTVPRNTPMKELVPKVDGSVIGISDATSKKTTKVSVEDMKVGGSGSARIVGGTVVAKEHVKAKFVINCAGSYSDKIAAMVGDTSFKIKPRLGDYLLLNRNQGHLAKHTIFPCPDPVLGKGVLVQTTLWGNLILGPTARDMHKAEVADMSDASIQHYILSKCQKLVPAFDPKETIHAFCGARAKSDRGDWIIENSVANGRMIHVAGIDSPGLAGSPAIALEVVRLLEESPGFLDKNNGSLQKNPNFNPRRAPIITPKQGGMRGLKVGPVGKNDSDGVNEAQMATNVICKCEKVTELEIVRALRRSLPIDSTQAIRKRTRAGMGHCQGDPENFNCEARVKAIIARECGVPIEQVGGRPWPATSTLPKRWPDEGDKQELEERMKNE